MTQTREQLVMLAGMAGDIVNTANRDVPVDTLEQTLIEEQIAHVRLLLDIIQQTSCGHSPAWRSVQKEMPDADETVMIFHADEDEPVWMGYFDGEQWRQVDGVLASVTHWAPLMEPPVVVTLKRRVVA
jgi:hypothetical protein